MVHHDVLWRKNGRHGFHDREESLSVRDEDLDVLGGFRNLRGRAQEIRLRAECAVPQPDLISGTTQVGRDSVSNDAKPDYAGNGFA
jgi:hypothetical protein